MSPVSVSPEFSDSVCHYESVTLGMAQDPLQCTIVFMSTAWQVKYSWNHHPGQEIEYYCTLEVRHCVPSQSQSPPSFGKGFDPL